MARATAFGYIVDGDVITGPDNYKYKIVPSIAGRAEYFVAVGLRSSSIEESQNYWANLLGMQVLQCPSQLSLPSDVGRTLTVGYSQDETALHFIQVTRPLQ